MSKEISIKIKIADYELEVTGPKEWAEEQIAKFVTRIRRQQAKALRKQALQEKA